jgi:hypothetical protein
VPGTRASGLRLALHIRLIGSRGLLRNTIGGVDIRRPV